MLCIVISQLIFDRFGGCHFPTPPTFSLIWLFVGLLFMLLIIAKNMLFFTILKCSVVYIHVACAAFTLVGCLVPLVWILCVKLELRCGLCIIPFEFLSMI